MSVLTDNFSGEGSPLWSKAVESLISGMSIHNSNVAPDSIMYVSQPFVGDNSAATVETYAKPGTSRRFRDHLIPTVRNTFLPSKSTIHLSLTIPEGSLKICTNGSAAGVLSDITSVGCGAVANNGLIQSLVGRSYNVPVTFYYGWDCASCIFKRVGLSLNGSEIMINESDTELYRVLTRMITQTITDNVRHTSSCIPDVVGLMNGGLSSACFKKIDLIANITFARVDDNNVRPTILFSKDGGSTFATPSLFRFSHEQRTFNIDIDVDTLGPLFATLPALSSVMNGLEIFVDIHNPLASMKWSLAGTHQRHDLLSVDKVQSLSLGSVNTILATGVNLEQPITILFGLGSVSSDSTLPADGTARTAAHLLSNNTNALAWSITRLDMIKYEMNCLDVDAINKILLSGFFVNYNRLDTARRTPSASNTELRFDKLSFRNSICSLVLPTPPINDSLDQTHLEDFRLNNFGIYVNGVPAYISGVPRFDSERDPRYVIMAKNTLYDLDSSPCPNALRAMLECPYDVDTTDATTAPYGAAASFWRNIHRPTVGHFASGMTEGQSRGKYLLNNHFIVLPMSDLSVTPGFTRQDNAGQLIIQSGDLARTQYPLGQITGVTTSIHDSDVLLWNSSPSHGGISLSTVQATLVMVCPSSMKFMFSNGRLSNVHSEYI